MKYVLGKLWQTWDTSLIIPSISMSSAATGSSVTSILLQGAKSKSYLPQKWNPSNTKLKLKFQRRSSDVSVAKKKFSFDTHFMPIFFILMSSILVGMT